MEEQPINIKFEGVTSAEAALKKIHETDLDVVISDIHMPKMNGLELLAKLKTNSNTSPRPVALFWA